MNIRKIKKHIKIVGSERDIKIAINSFKWIKFWAKSNHKKSKHNMRILTANLYKDGRFI